MKVKCSNLNVVVSVLSTFFFVNKCDFAVPVRTSSMDNQTIESYSPIYTTCNLSTVTEGYCVPIRSCLTILVILNHSDIRARRCGPHNENNKNPFVCCEKHYVESDVTTPLSLDPQQSSTHPYTQRIPQNERRKQNFTSSTTQRIPTSQRPQPPFIVNGSPEGQAFEPPELMSPDRKPLEDIEAPHRKNPFGQCGVQDIVSRIVGGEPSTEKEFPWLGRLLRRDSRGDMVFSCTGALITSRVVLTTAHCLVSRPLVTMGDLYAVALGEHQTECGLDSSACLSNKKTVVVSRLIAHPEYNTNSRNHDNDIGLIILRDEVKFTDHIMPICLLENTMEATEYFVAGWGKTETGAVSGVKLKISLPPFSWSQCAKKYTEIRVELTQRQICAGGVEGVDSCQGDSGGPLMVRREMKWYVAGVVSFGLGCGRKGWPGIYVYTPHYLNWIKEIVRGQTT